MYAKITDGELLFVTSQLPKKQIEVESEEEETIIQEVDDDTGFIELTEEQHNILKQWGKYIDGEFVFPEKTIEQQIKEIKLQCRKDILAEYSESDQVNMTANVARINALAKRENRDFTDEENAILDAADAMYLFVANRLKQCEEEIQNLTNNS